MRLNPGDLLQLFIVPLYLDFRAVYGADAQPGHTWTFEYTLLRRIPELLVLDREWAGEPIPPEYARVAVGTWARALLSHTFSACSPREAALFELAADLLGWETTPWLTFGNIHELLESRARPSRAIPDALVELPSLEVPNVDELVDELEHGAEQICDTTGLRLVLEIEQAADRVRLCATPQGSGLPDVPSVITYLWEASAALDLNPEAWQSASRLLNSVRHGQSLPSRVHVEKWRQWPTKPFPLALDRIMATWG